MIIMGLVRGIGVMAVMKITTHIVEMPTMIIVTPENIWMMIIKNEYDTGQEVISYNTECRKN
jgi:hypothetical protein